MPTGTRVGWCHGDLSPRISQGPDFSQARVTGYGTDVPPPVLSFIMKKNNRLRFFYSYLQRGGAD